MNPPAPEISVVLPTFNRAALLPRAVRSVLAQSMERRWELIIVDDASDDDTEDVVKGFGGDRIRYIRHTANRNGAAARNTGISAARGRWIALLDSDDEWLPEHLERKVRLLKRTGADGIFGSFHIDWGNRRRTVRCAPLERPKELAQYLFGAGAGDVCTPTLVFRAEALRGVMFDDSLSKHQDWDLALRFGAQHRLVVDEEPTVVVHPVDPGRMSATMNHAATRAFLSKHSHRMDDRALAWFYFGLAHRSYRYDGRTAETRAYVREGWRRRHHLDRTKRWFLGSMTVPGIGGLAVSVGTVAVALRNAAKDRVSSDAAS